MTNREIDNFIRRYGGNNIHFYIHSKQSKCQLACTGCFGKNKKTNKYIYIIILNKNIFRNKKIPIGFLKAILLHEIGHIKKGHFHKKISLADGEFEAMIWGLIFARKRKFNKILFFIISIFMDWANFKNKKRLNYYFKAYTKFRKLMGNNQFKKILRSS